MLLLTRVRGCVSVRTAGVGPWETQLERRTGMACFGHDVTNIVIEMLDRSCTGSSKTTAAATATGKKGQRGHGSTGLMLR